MACKCDFFGIFCFLFLYLLIAYTDYVCVFQILAIDQEQLLSFYILAAGYQVVLFMLIWSHLMCLCSDPGTVDLTMEFTKKKKVLKDQQIGLQSGSTSDESTPAVCSSPCEIEYILPTSLNNIKIYQNGSGTGNINNTATVIRSNAMLSQQHQQFQQRSLYLSEPFEWTFCRFCNIYRPPRAHHCQICRRCILRRDHHCPWINNCVGEYNLKYFLQFTSYAFAGSLYTIACIVISFLYSSVNSPLKISIHVALLILASVIFGIFSVAVLCDQVQGLFNDQTNIERIKGQKGPKQGRMRMLRATCGYISVFLWFLPLPLGLQNNQISNQSQLQSSELSKDAVDVEQLWNQRDQLYAL